MYLHLIKSDAGTVPTYKKLCVGTIPVSKLFIAGTVPASNYYKRRIMRTQSKGHLFILFRVFISRPKIEEEKNGLLDQIRYNKDQMVRSMNWYTIWHPIRTATILQGLLKILRLTIIFF